MGISSTPLWGKGWVTDPHPTPSGEANCQAPAPELMIVAGGAIPKWGHCQSGIISMSPTPPSSPHPMRGQPTPTTNPPSSPAWRIPSSTGEHLRTLGSTNRHTLYPPHREAQNVGVLVIWVPDFYTPHPPSSLPRAGDEARGHQAAADGPGGGPAAAPPLEHQGPAHRRPAGRAGCAAAPGGVEHEQQAHGGPARRVAPRALCADRRPQVAGAQPRAGGAGPGLGHEPGPPAAGVCQVSSSPVLERNPRSVSTWVRRREESKFLRFWPSSP